MTMVAAVRATLVVLVLMFIEGSEAEGVPLFARRYNVSCQTCHVTPPRVNAMGEEFAARGYQFPDPVRASSTVPTAVWISMLGQRQPGRDFLRSFPNRIEFVASDALGSSGIAYFIEWRALSVELQGDGKLRDRSGRFEDVFVTGDFGGNVAVTAGQFRMLTQVDVSRRLSVSEPLVFAASLAGKPASTSRLSSLRAFSPSSRSPAIRVQYRSEVFDGDRAADGLFAIVNIPMSGELSLPLTNEARTNASFELEAKPKGLFVESFVRRGLTSIGAHVFAGDNRRFLAQAVGSARLFDLFVTAVWGAAKVEKKMLTNMMLEAEYVPTHFAAIALRLEHQIGSNRNPAVVSYGAVHFPGSTYTIRLGLEHRVQKGNIQSSVEASLIY